MPRLWGALGSEIRALNIPLSSLQSFLNESQR